MSHAEIGKLVGKAESWSRRLVKWKVGGYVGAPFDSSHPKKSSHATKPDLNPNENPDPETDNDAAEPEQERRQPNNNGDGGKDDDQRAEDKQLWELYLDLCEVTAKARNLSKSNLSAKSQDDLARQIEWASAELHGILAHFKDEVESPRVVSISEDFEVLEDCGRRWAVFAHVEFGNFYDKAAAERWANAQKKW